MHNLGIGISKQYRPIVYGRNPVRPNSHMRHNSQHRRQNFSWWSMGATMPNIYPANRLQFNGGSPSRFGF